MIYELLFFLIIILIFGLAINNNELISPPVVFCLAFCFACSWAMIYAKRWDLNLHRNTFWIILGGVLVFVVSSFIIKSISDLIGKEKTQTQTIEFKKIKVEKWKKVILLMICIFTILYTMYFIINVTNGNWTKISSAINTYRKMTVFNSTNSRIKVGFPKILSLCRYAVNAMGYWFIYLIINNYFAEKKIDILSVFIVVSSAVSGMTTGGRGYAIYIILAGIAIIVLFLNKKNTYRKKVDFKTIIIFATVFLTMILAFQTTGNLLGKVATSKKSINAMGSFDYLAVYCGAMIKNLDIFVRERLTIIRTTNNVWGSQTFIYLIRWFGPMLGITKTNYVLDLPYRMVNGFNLGNVYTTFYPYIYDFGYKGVVVLTGLMAVISQFIYEKCKKIKLTNIPSISILTYSYIFNTLAFSFFSNKFYELVLSKQFVYTIIMWWLYNIFLCKIKLNKTKDKLHISNSYIEMKNDN